MKCAAVSRWLLVTLCGLVYVVNGADSSEGTPIVDLGYALHRAQISPVSKSPCDSGGVDMCAAI